MIFIGIDPGLTGAISSINVSKKGSVVRVADTPILTVQKGNKNKREFIPSGMVELVNEFTEYRSEFVQVFIEQVGAMPKQGVSSVFSFGRGYGIWIGIIAALGLPVTFVTPQRWKKVMMDGIADKDAARLRTMQLFPQMSEALKLKKHDGRAEAILIAEYGRRSLRDRRNAEISP